MSSFANQTIEAARRALAARLQSAAHDSAELDARRRGIGAVGAHHLVERLGQRLGGLGALLHRGRGQLARYRVGHHRLGVDGVGAELCRREGIPIEVRPVTVQALRDADEIFATSTAGGVMPVTRIDGRILGNGAPGALTSSIRDLYWAWHQNPGETTPVEYA